MLNPDEEAESDLPEYPGNSTGISDLVSTARADGTPTANQIRDLADVIQKYQAIFSEKRGGTDLFTTHNIKLPTNISIRSRPYSVSPRQEHIIRHEINKFLENGESEYVSLIILVEVPTKES